MGRTKTDIFVLRSLGIFISSPLACQQKATVAGVLCSGSCRDDPRVPLRLNLDLQAVGILSSEAGTRDLHMGHPSNKIK